MRNLFIGVLLLVAGLSFANPFLGDWTVTTFSNPDHYNLTFTSDGELLDTTPPLTSVGPYTYTDTLLTFNQTNWLYTFIDSNHFLIFSWGRDHSPSLLRFIRKDQPKEDHT